MLRLYYILAFCDSIGGLCSKFFFSGENVFTIGDCEKFLFTKAGGSYENGFISLALIAEEKRLRITVVPSL
jgi:hypothetical protein